MRRRRKPISLLISIVILTVALTVLIQAGKHEKAENARMGIFSIFQRMFTSYKQSVFTSRRPPLSVMELEANLKNSLPDPFVRFSPREWRWFWNLLYGRHEVDSSWPRTVRQLTREEVEAELIFNYDYPFFRYNDRQWNAFWGQILKGKVF
jgi:hypothetical protein